ncbi:hypothetical protein KDN32_06170 [Nocardioides sp. J2M5]|uniref:hypothetical protein n=1 Tax=Nocardioides palaemonis TaxID=2829810 RepID=UPI001BA83C2A|nr:hypothetical protein [Nocardioides palaemonis]MBS2937323.1 hypothetical protein [Nocardioides palaemonis]
MDDWRQVELDGATITGLLVGHVEQAVAYGSRGDRPLAVLLDASGVKKAITPLGSGPVTSACHYSGMYDVVVGRAHPVLTTHEFFGEHLPGCGCHGRIEDSTTEGAVRLWTVCDSDENVLVLTIRADGWLVQGESVDGSQDPGRGLRVVGDVEDVDLWVSPYSFDEMLVSGPLVGGDGRTSLVWRSGAAGWVPHETPRAMDAVTSNGTRHLAGHHDLHPVISGVGPASAPDVDLDPDWPHVTQLDHHLVALQGAAGPQLWSWAEDAWIPEALPPGRLSGGVRAQPWDDEWPGETVEADDRLFVIIDGQIWHRPYRIG